MTTFAVTDEPEPVNVVLTFVDQDGSEWLAGAIMTPLQRGDDTVEVQEMPDRVFVLKGFTVVTR